MLHLYLLQQDESTGYDTYDSMVVVAVAEEEAKRIHPSGKIGDFPEINRTYLTWASSPDHVQATWIGLAATNLTAGEIVCASFNAG